MEAARSSETLVSYHITARHQKTEDRDLNPHRRENHKSSMTFCKISYVRDTISTNDELRYKCKMSLQDL